MPDLFQSPKPVKVPISNQPGLLFPVNRIYCIGLNYAAHAQEIYQSTDKANTFFFFTKPQDTILHSHQSIVCPMKTNSFKSLFIISNGLYLIDNIRYISVFTGKMAGLCQQTQA